MKKIILASTSPRRIELMEKTGLPFEAVASSYEEDMTLALQPEDLVKHLSKGKAQAVAFLHPEAVVIGADTIVVHGNTVLGKPHTAPRAKEILMMLSGTSHSVVTGFTIINGGTRHLVSKVVETKIHFKKISEEIINKYVATGDPLDKAGAYGIQGLAGEFIDRIEGDYSNVIGLPIEAVVETLKDFGISI